ncbi:MAG TPA: hypothetical protein H9812_07765 [Candidatus Gallimonas intestinigallinarum]|uniref:Uncharacterized protein n=1 Tax=Candidatus Gallimonas intestinigallinarum TaxID=2838604 RepID=A0A9D2DXZ8_9FIRM|nr:hypothetical protein [Candidatus Gallimonas intestinigallinarum]
MISDGQLEQNLQQGEIAARERGLRGTCRALIGCGIATAALFWGFVIVAFLLPADETAANYDAIAVVLAVLFLILAGISIATIVLGIVYGVKCRRFARLKKQYARRMQGISGSAAVSASPAASAPQTKDAVQPAAPSTPASQENGTQAMQEALPARTEVLQRAPAQPVQPTQPAQSVFAPQRTERAQTYSALPQVSPLPAPQPPVKRRSRYWLWGIAAAFVLLVVALACISASLPYSDLALRDSAYAIAAGVFCVAFVSCLIGYLYLRSEETGAELAAFPPYPASVDARSYSLSRDKNMRSLDYLFPEPSLRARAQTLRRQYTKAVYIGFCVGLAVGMAVLLVLQLPIALDAEADGWAFPLVIGCAFVFGMCAGVPFLIKLAKVEKRNVAMLEREPRYADNLLIYRKYEAHSKGRGRIPTALYLASIVLGVLLAALIPAQPVSVVAAILLIVGAALNNHFVKKLRLSVIPIEAKIDQAHASDGEKTEQEGDRTGDQGA